MKYKIITAFLLSWISLGAVNLKQEVVDDLLQSYYSIGQALANDDLESAQEYAVELLSKTGGAHMGKSHKSMPISNAAELLASAQEINQARFVFRDLSDVFIKTVRASGTGEHSSGLIVKCSMAFDGQGAQWIQPTSKVANPFYGESMLRCGNVIGATVIAKADDSCCSPKPSSSDCDDTHKQSQSCHSTEHEQELRLIPASQQILDQQIDTYPNTCVVSDEALIEGEILDYQYGDQLVRFCCKGCKGDFIETPELFLSKIDKLKHSSHDRDHSSGHDHSAHKH